MLVKVNTNDLMPLPTLFRLVLKCIYEKDKVTIDEVTKMEASIVKWSEYINSEKQKILDKYGIQANDFQPLGTKGTPLDEQEFALSGYAWLLREDESGNLEARKEMFKRHNIDYRKFYSLPESFNESDFEKAQEALKIAMANDKENYI